MLLSNQYHQKYFLRILEDGTVRYPLLEEFQALHQKYNKSPLHAVYMQMQFDTIVHAVKEKGQKMYHLIPKVIDGKRLVQVFKKESMLTDEEKFFEKSKQKVKVLPGQMFQLKEYIDEKDEKNIICDTIQEFKQYLEYQDPTYDDLKKILECKDIKPIYQQWIKEGIENLRQELPHADLSVLYYNLSRLKIIEKSQEEIQKDMNNEAARAYYLPRTAECVINAETIDEWNLCHEILGHAFTQAYVGNVIYRTELIYSVPFEEEGVYALGQGCEEAKAEMIAYLATGKRNLKKNGYAAEVEQFKVIMETIGMTLEEFLNGGMRFLMEKMYAQGIKKPTEYLETIDVISDASSMEERRRGMKNNLRDFLYAYRQAQMEGKTNLESFEEER